MNNSWIVLPILFQLVSAVVLLLTWGNIKIQKIVSILLSAIGLGIGIWLFLLIYNHGIQVTQSGNWPAPFGITFVADTFGSTMVLLASIAGFSVSIFAAGSMSRARLRFGFFPLLHFLIMGLQGAFLTGDIFNLYVWFEVIIISSFVLITIGGKKAQLEGAIKYVALNLLASIFFLIGIAFLYGLTGSLNMADLATKVQEIDNKGLINVTASLFLVAFGIKSAVFPLYFWLPASYHTPPAAVGAIFGGLLTKVGVYAMVRTFTLIFAGDVFLSLILSVMAALTILSGALGAMYHRHLGKIFGYLIICHIGFMMAGVGMMTELAIVGTVFYLVHDIIVKTNLFMVSGLILKINGTQDIKELGGMYKSKPLLSLLMAIPLFSLVGIPPLSGFWAKLFFIKGGLESKEYFLIAFIILGSFLTLWVIAKVWSEVFWKDAVNLPKKSKGIFFHELSSTGKWVLVLPVIFLSIISLYIGFGAEHIVSLSQRIASELMNPASYIETVLSQKTIEP
ncbi:Na(+) H(+) antiporter subunit D [Indibacter alkaliphilus LW1]|uniref:Na(+) H(+) antiporter subunit D n=1 Tax=Indibacter alkaliphilus (strain CCUG 57479 / KCTC 22604 / LW1) TaxID=1189612 RepID=S2E1W3_INDAL|nr:proton-conducting transporter membrane subunit [Indibacter alkaliphilus]EOZ98466.1 Na(+) H(+) antiporter subunit D [Indibacter alkaliphilus LW1]